MHKLDADMKTLFMHFDKEISIDRNIVYSVIYLEYIFTQHLLQ